MARPAGLQVKLHPNLTPTQKEVLRYPDYHLILEGPAGTSKTYLALARGLSLLKNDDVEKIIIIRSAVETRSIGFLPGGRDEKMEAYAAPYIHLISELSPQRNYAALMNTKLLEFHSTSFLRGCTFDDAFIICDEYQNMNAHELETIVTRVGERSHLCLCGDGDQSDLRGDEAREHKLVLEILTQMEEFYYVKFGVEDIVRSDFVRRYYEVKEQVYKGGVKRTLA